MRLNEILDQVSSYAQGADLDVIMRAYVYSARAHAGQMRKSGEPYLIHPLAVAGILADLRMDVDTIATGLLHDTMEDCLISTAELTDMFGGEVAEMVDGVTKMGKLQFKNRETAQAENFRKMMLAMGRDVRVILVKLADRLHNMRTMGAMKPAKQVEISRETMDIYAPIANRLGLSELKSELEDLCFQYLHPEVWQVLNGKLQAGEQDRQAYITQTCGVLKDQLALKGLECQVSGRVKHLYGIYSKMQEQSLEFEQVHDTMAFRIHVDDVGQCYTALGHIHSLYTPYPDRIKDYIATPKNNGYRSLHTVVNGPGGRQIEVQIRTHEMHRIAEVGIAAHWRYKEGHLALSREDIGKIARLRELFDAAREVDDPQEFLETIKVDLFSNEIFAFTPAGDVKVFPQGATALDFAYAIHSEVGDHCTGALVNGRIVPLRYVLQNGDRVEIRTSKEQKPSRDWQDWAITGRALSKIRRAIREEEREKGRELGKEMLEKELKRYGLSLQKEIKNGKLGEVGKKLGYRRPESLFLALATAHTTLNKIIAELVPAETIAKVEAEENEEPQSALGQIWKKIVKPRSESPVLICGEEDVLVTYARCCNPLPGEPVVGYITTGRGISVHLVSCKQLMGLDPARRIDVKWHPKSRGTHTSEVRLVCKDTPGMLAEVGAACKTNSINVARMEAHGIEDKKAVLKLEVCVGDVSELQGLIRSLETIDGVISVDRVKESGRSIGA